MIKSSNCQCSYWTKMKQSMFLENLNQPKVSVFVLFFLPIYLLPFQNMKSRAHCFHVDFTILGVVIL
ncbi:unnamed protein product [Arabidopsis halleri]